jgi:hypothetical protein
LVTSKANAAGFQRRGPRRWAALGAVALFLGFAGFGDSHAQQQSGPQRAEPSAEDMRAQVLERDARLLAEHLEGRYDNELQVFFDVDLKTPPEQRRTRAHLSVRKLDAPAIGKAVFLWEQHDPTNPAAAPQRMVVRLGKDEAAGAVTLERFTFKAAQDGAGAMANPAVLAGLVPDRLIATPGCTLFLNREEAQFRGATRPGACATPGVTKAVLIGADRIWLDAAGPPAPMQLRRIRPFSCWVFVLRGAGHGDSGEGNQNWQIVRDLWIHDQGGVARVVTDETPARTVRLRLRNVEWPFGANRPSLTLYVLEGEKDRAVSYAWTEANATRLGANLRWVQASCTHAPNRVWDGL